MQTTSATPAGQIHNDPKDPIYRVVVAAGQIGSEPAVMMVVMVIMVTAIAHS